MKRLVLLLVLLTSSPAWAQSDLAGVTVLGGPSDVASWPITSTITRLTETPVGEPSDGFHFDFSTSETWPDCVAFGDGGQIQYTVWPVFTVGGQRYTFGAIQMWKGRVNTGAPFLSNWVHWHDGKFGGIPEQYMPQVGDIVGFFLTSGNERMTRDVTCLRERTNVFYIPLPAGDRGTFTSGAPVPTPVPTPTDTTTQKRLDDLEAFRTDVLKSVDALVTTLTVVQQQLASLGTELDAVQGRVMVLEARPMVVSCTASLFGSIPVKCALQWK